jgi:hypothetical protein
LARLRNFLKRILVAGVALTALTGSFGIDQVEFSCEEAAAHLQECCPAFDPHSLYCHSGGCGTPTIDLTQSQSDCILGATCDDLRTSGTCDAPTRVTCP